MPRKTRQPRKEKTVTVSPPPPPPPEIPLDDPSHYRNRELSLLEFQRRVLEEALDPRNKLLERVKFVSIVSSNLDEFFMVRVAALKQKLAQNRTDLSIDGRNLTEQLEAVRASADQVTQQIYACFQEQLLPALAEEHIVIADYASLSEPNARRSISFTGRRFSRCSRPLRSIPAGRSRTSPI